jgi:hypothetical protein
MLKAAPPPRRLEQVGLRQSSLKSAAPRARNAALLGPAAEFGDRCR